MKKHSYVQYGCGWSCPSGWENFDSSPSLRIERIPLVGRFIAVNSTRFPENVKIGDIVKGLPLPTGHVSGVYASHVLEHLSYKEFWVALKNTYDLLRPGGIFRLVVPDLESRARAYIDGLDQGCPKSNNKFLRQTYLGREDRPRSLLSRTRFLLGNSNHLWMWDYSSMARALLDTGFSHVRRADFNDSADEMFKLVETESRFYWSPAENGTPRYRECAVEALK